MHVVWESLKYWMWNGLLYGAGLGILYVTIASENLNIAGGVILGAPFGTATGLFTGFVDGLFLGLVCHFFFNPVRNPNRFRWTILVLATLLTYIGTLLFLVVLLPIPFSGRPGELNEHGISLFQLPSIMAAAGVIYAAFRFVRNYLVPKVTSSPEVPSPAGTVSQGR